MENFLYSTYFLLKNEPHLQNVPRCKSHSLLCFNIKFCLYSDVIDGLLYLMYSKHQQCGHLFDFEHTALYITGNEKVQLLPPMELGDTKLGDLTNLVKHIRAILALPCAGRGVTLNCLPKNLLHLLTIIHPYKLYIYFS